MPGSSNKQVHFQFGETYNKWRGYGQARIVNMLFAINHVGKVSSDSLLAFSLHPSIVVMNFG